MFTGIIETCGEIVKIEREQGNVHFTVRSDVSNALKIDQSIAHDGVCLTVVHVQDDMHRVTAIQETLDKTTLGNWITGTQVNLERCLQAGARLDGHMVQGHVDGRAKVIAISETAGSWAYRFAYHSQEGHFVVPKGSICVNGVSLTVVEASPEIFSVAIIPYTYEHTTFKYLQVGDEVNLEFDVLGKYVVRYLSQLPLSSLLAMQQGQTQGA